jgi:hypothetical protein
MEGLVDRNRGIISGLAFFPVVAISTNLSTRFYWHKANKNISDKQKINQVVR